MKDKIVTIVLSIILFIVPIAIIPNTWGEYNIVKIIILLVCGFILLITTLIGINKIKFDKMDIPILIFGTLAILSTIFSKDINKSIIGEENRYEGLLTIITYVLIYYNSKYYFKSYKKFIPALSIIYISICIFAIIQFLVGNNIKLPPIFAKGANGTFGNTNFMGSFVSIVLPAFILGAIFKNRIIYYIGSIASFSAMLACAARSSFVAFFISIILIITYLIIQKNKNYWKRFSILIIIVIVCFTIIDLIDSNQRIPNKINSMVTDIKQAIKIGLSDEMGTGRIGIWKITIKLVEKVPILGCGVDALSSGLEQILPEENSNFIAKSYLYIDKAHNEYLQIAATMGIPALLAYLTFIGMVLISGVKKMLKHKVIAIYIIVIISYLTQAFFNISTIGIAPIFWFILGMASRNINRKKRDIIKIKH